MARNNRMSSAIEQLEPRRLLSVAYPISIGFDHGKPNMLDAAGMLYTAAANTLYRSDGTSGSAEIITGSSARFFEWNGSAYAGTYNPPELVRIDPDSSMPVPIECNCQNFDTVDDFVGLGNKIFFSGTDSAHDFTNVYVTEVGSQSALWLGPGRPIGVAGGYVLIGGNSQLLRSDGTIAGTSPIKSGIAVQPIAEELGSSLIFCTDSGLYRSDGTANGTYALGVGGVIELHSTGGLVYAVTSVGAQTNKLWVTDGTPGGTAIRAEIAGGALSWGDATMANIGESLFYFAYAPSGFPEIFRIEPNGTKTQVTSMSSVQGDGVARGFAAVNGKLVFSARTGQPYYRAWIGDGTPGNYSVIPGTFTDGSSIDEAPTRFIGVGGSLYFAQNPWSGGVKLFRYAMTAAQIDNRTLVIYGTDAAEGGTGADTISVAQLGVGIAVSVNGVLFSFNAADVDRVVINAMGGSDNVTIDPVLAKLVVYNASTGIENFQVATAGEDDILTITPVMVDANGIKRVLRGIDTLNVSSGDGADTINITGGPAMANFLDTGAGNDLITVGNGFISSLVNSWSLAGGADDDELAFDDSLNPAGRTITLTGTTFAPTGLATITFSGMEGDVSLILGNGSDTITATPSTTAIWAINGGLPGFTAAAPGDILKLNLAGATGGSRLMTSPSTGQYTFDNRQPLSFSNIEVSEDFAAPFVMSGAINVDSSLPVLSLTFSEAMPTRPLQPVLSVKNVTTGVTIPAFTSFSYSYITNTGSWVIFVNSPLPQGNYRITMSASGIKDATGNALASDYVFETFILPGDANRDRKIDANDLGILSSNWQSSNKTFSQGDFNYDGKVDVKDLYILASKWQQTLLPPPPPLVAQAAGLSGIAAKRAAARMVTLVQ